MDSELLRIRIEALRVARSANITTQASGGRRPQQQPGILRFYAEETPGLKIGPTTVTRPRRFHCH